MIKIDQNHNLAKGKRGKSKGRLAEGSIQMKNEINNGDAKKGQKW